MTIISVNKDSAALTMTIVTHYAAPTERVWELWADPRQLERWWGPPTYPATVEEHDLRPGGKVTYFMTGPDGDQPRGWWTIMEVDPPRRLVITDGFADDSGNPNDDLPTMMIHVEVAERDGGGSAMSIRTVFPSIEAMNQILEMGAEEGMRQALGQIDPILAG